MEPRSSSALFCLTTRPSRFGPRSLDGGRGRSGSRRSSCDGGGEFEGIFARGFEHHGVMQH
eukprot:3368717-Pyramimonas_sp.AAC.1